LACALVPLLTWLVSFAYIALYRWFGVSYATLGLIQFIFVFTLLLLPTTLMGGTLPILSQALVRGEGTIGRTVGTLYAMNTLAAIVGGLLTGYVLLPMIGNLATLAVGIIVNLAVGIAAIGYSRRVVGAFSLNRPIEPTVSVSQHAFHDARPPVRLEAWLT